MLVSRKILLLTLYDDEISRVRSKPVWTCIAFIISNIVLIVSPVQPINIMDSSLWQTINIPSVGLIIMACQSEAKLAL